VKKTPNWAINLSLLLASSGLCFIILEIVCRIFPWTEYNEYQLNNPYYYIERIGNEQPYSPYSTYKERVPLQFDHHFYYAPTDGIVCFHSNQFGARWIEPADQPLEASSVLVLGDSFTYGHGLHYEDTFVYRLQRKLEEGSNRISFLNFAKRGTDAEEILNIYRRFKDTVPHDAVLYGLHINDLVAFTTSYIITNPLAVPWIVERSKGFDFIAKSIHKLLIRRYRIKQLTDPLLFEEPNFVNKLNALVMLNEAAKNNGVRFYVALLPILVDLKKDTFHPLYDGIRRALDDHKIEYFDLTESLSGFDDRDVWVLPFDQHPNEKANKVFADRLFEEFQRREIIARLVEKNKFADRYDRATERH
jgi:lysophospholipase L1-like esterase